MWAHTYTHAWTHTCVHAYVYCKKRAFTVTEAKRSWDLQSVSWRPRGANGIVPVWVWKQKKTDVLVWRQSGREYEFSVTPLFCMMTGSKEPRGQAIGQLSSGLVKLPRMMSRMAMESESVSLVLNVPWSPHSPMTGMIVLFPRLAGIVSVWHTFSPLLHLENSTHSSTLDATFLERPILTFPI